jgi:hypothetical protein
VVSVGNHKPINAENLDQWTTQLPADPMGAGHREQHATRLISIFAPTACSPMCGITAS